MSNKILVIRKSSMLAMAKGAPFGNQNAFKGNSEKQMKKMPIGIADKWLVDEAKKAGLYIEGFKHEITNEFITHVIRNHGNEKIESARGQIAINESDFSLIPAVLKKPDYTIVGAKRDKKNILIYAKKMEDGTTLYFEEVLSGKKNRSLRGKSTFKKKGSVNEKNLKSIVTMNEKTDLSGAKIVIGGGGNSPSEINKNVDLAVATSTYPADNNIHTISHKSLKKSRSKRLLIKKSTAAALMKRMRGSL